jgi:phospholipid transport system substrate-binding protein
MRDMVEAGERRRRMGMGRRWTAVAGTILVSISLGVHPVWAGELIDSVRSTTDQVIDVLRDPELKAKPEVRDKRIWAIVSTRFDFEEMARRSLAIHWRDRSPQEQREFVELFGHLLQRSYSGKLDQYTDEAVEYLGEEVEGARAEVRSKVVSKGMEISIDYRLMPKPSGWMVYDVVIEGVSLVNNYRTQFNRIVVSSGYNELVKRLRNKWEELIKETEKQRTEKQKKGST